MNRSVRLRAVLARRRSAAPSALAFCGFYVAKADTKLFNQASQVVARARRRQHRPHHGQRLPGRPQGVRARRAGADRAREGPDPRRRPRAHRAPRRLHRAAPRRVLRRRPLRAAVPPTRCRRAAARRSKRTDAQAERAREPRRHHRGPVHGGRVRHPDPVRAARAPGSRPGCARTATACPAGASPVLGSYIKQGMKFFVAR